MYEAKPHRSATVFLGVTLALALVTGSVAAAAAGPEGATLGVEVSGLKHTRGSLVAKLFRRGDAAPKGNGYQRVTVRLTNRQPKIEFPGVPYGQYALLVFHDENDNGTMDHNFLGIPTEPLGFSAGFRVSLVSGIPDFDDLKFIFSEASPTQSVKVR